MDFFRLLPFEHEHAFLNMALDEAVSEAVRQRRSPPTLRLYGWERPSLSLGFFQPAAEVDLDYCDKKNYPVVRRLTGGRAVLHDAELTYSIVARSDSPFFRGSLYDTYTAVSNALMDGMKRCGVEAVASFPRKRGRAPRNPSCFKSVSYGEITVQGKKIIGSAQRRFSDGFLQHGSILMQFNRKEHQRVLRLEETAGLDDIGALHDFVPELTVAGLQSQLRKAFEAAFSMKLISDAPSVFERSLAKKLVQGKYAAAEWNHRR